LISIIVCSINKELLRQLKTNIADTIGTPFELIAIDNNIEKKSICAVYNEGAEKAKHACLCFLHEDVIIHSKDWGVPLTALLSDEQIGLVGVSGAVYKSRYPGTWSACDPGLYRTHSIQHFENRAEAKEININPEGKNWSEVAVIDGVFMATTKKVFENFRFDDELLKGFHGYDIDYSLQVGSKYKVVVTYRIFLAHFSSGNLNKEWLKYSLLVHEKWKKKLPKSVVDIDTNSKQISDYLSNQCVINVAMLDRQKWWLVMSVFCRMVLKYYQFNKLKYSRQVALFLINKRYS